MIVKNKAPLRSPIQNAVRAGVTNQDQKSPAIANGAIQAQSSFGNAAVNATADATEITIASVRVEVRMLRSIGLAFSLVAIMLAACGRQVTFPAPGTIAGLPSGNMLIRYTVSGPFDFTDYTYAIVFNTSANGGTPYANTQFNGGFLNYSFAWFIGGKFGTVQSPPVLLQYYLTPGSTTNVGTQQIVVPLNLATLTLNSNGQNTQFTLLFSRTLLDRPPIGAATPSPSPTPTALPSGVTPTPSPTPLPPGVTPSPSPLPSNSCSVQFLYVCDTWYVNFFVLDQNGVPLDALGLNGRTDTTFSLPLPTNTIFDYVNQLTVPAGAVGTGNASTTIAGGEIKNAFP
jgi:hypothetical protein